MKKCYFQSDAQGIKFAFEGTEKELLKKVSKDIADSVKAANDAKKGVEAEVKALEKTMTKKTYVPTKVDAKKLLELELKAEYYEKEAKRVGEMKPSGFLFFTMDKVVLND